MSKRSARMGIFARRGMRAMLMMVVAAAACWGLATAVVSDRPAAIPDLSTLCVSAVVATTDAAAPLISAAAGHNGPADASGVGVVLALVLGVALAVIVVGLRLERFWLSPRGVTATPLLAHAPPRESGRRVLTTLSVLRT